MIELIEAAQKYAYSIKYNTTNGIWTIYWRDGSMYTEVSTDLLIETLGCGKDKN